MRYGTEVATLLDQHRLPAPHSFRVALVRALLVAPLKRARLQPDLKIIETFTNDQRRSAKRHTRESRAGRNEGATRLALSSYGCAICIDSAGVSDASPVEAEKKPPLAPAGPEQKPSAAPVDSEPQPELQADPDIKEGKSRSKENEQNGIAPAAGELPEGGIDTTVVIELGTDGTVDPAQNLPAPPEV
jgi:hypothetical protein